MKKRQVHKTDYFCFANQISQLIDKSTQNALQKIQMPEEPKNSQIPKAKFRSQRSLKFPKFPKFVPERAKLATLEQKPRLPFFFKANCQISPNLKTCQMKPRVEMYRVY